MRFYSNIIIICLLYHSDEWWRDTLPLPSVHLCRPERVGCHQPCWLYLYMYECTEWCSNWCTIIMYNDNLLLGSQWCWFTRYLTVSKWPLAQARESGCHQPCWLALWKTTINNVTAPINTYYLDQHACWWEPWPSPGHHGNTQGREECLQPHSLQLWIQVNCGH